LPFLFLAFELSSGVVQAVVMLTSPESLSACFELVVSAGFAGKGASPPTGDPGAGSAAGVPGRVEVGWGPLPEFVPEGACAPGVLGRVVVGWAPLPEFVPVGVCAAGVFAGAGLDPVPLVWVDCAQTPAANASANPDRTASLKPMRSVAFMTSPPPRWVPAHTAPLRSTS